jgi:hypothetical protein
MSTVRLSDPMYSHDDAEPPPHPATFSISFTLPGAPVGKARARVTKNGTYTPRKTRRHGSAVRAAARAAIPMFRHGVRRQHLGHLRRLQVGDAHHVGSTAHLFIDFTHFNLLFAPFPIQ